MLTTDRLKNILCAAKIDRVAFVKIGLSFTRYNCRQMKNHIGALVNQRANLASIRDVYLAAPRAVLGGRNHIRKDKFRNVMALNTPNTLQMKRQLAPQHTRRPKNENFHDLD